MSVVGVGGGGKGGCLGLFSLESDVRPKSPHLLTWGQVRSQGSRPPLPAPVCQWGLNLMSLFWVYECGLGFMSVLWVFRPHLMTVSTFWQW